MPSFRVPLFGGGAGFLATGKSQVEYSKNHDNALLVVSEALRHTEMRLEDLEKFATSAERRIAGFATVSIALAATTFLYLERMPSFLCGLLSGIVIVFAVINSVSAIQPALFHTRGHFWRDWKGHLQDSDLFLDVLISQASENDARIEANEIHLDRMAKKTKLSFFMLVYSVLFNISAQIGALLVI